ncbi:MAG: aminomethyl-transferring glycine dehydrogenase subunit GcvPB [bacterium]
MLRRVPIRDPKTGEEVLEPLLFELGKPNRNGGFIPPAASEASAADLPASARRKSALALPELSEVEVIRHFTRLSTMNHNLDRDLYPLGSCTMKHNPRVNEETAALPGFAAIHPWQPDETVQGALAVLVHLERILAALTGMDRFTIQPPAGAAGEFTGIAAVLAYHHARGEDRRRKVIVPDSAHGTNPASVARLGAVPIEIKTGEQGIIDPAVIEAVVDDETAALMLTVPSTLGIFERHILKIAQIAHARGAQLYLDGANMNALMGLVRPADLGFDVMHINLHKTCSTPHGGGGPGAGPVGVRAHLAPFLPGPHLVNEDGAYRWESVGDTSVGRMHGFHGNFGILVRAYAFLRRHGASGLRAVSETAILNANYLQALLKDHYDLPQDRPCQHEFVLSAKNLRDAGVKTTDVAKRLLDYGFYAPTVYFPMIVPEALMIEPTETETKETLDRFAETMIAIAREARENPDNLRGAPHLTPVSRVDEAKAARDLDLVWRG